ncbi:hypothetical protein [Sphingobacterium sp. DR205]|uniref:hypothetical protein n=1 Tax=Sphingobacterium sp. DR205 TaxID=2713573 RepID=UPI0013E4E8FE|nr:hypothetical protein [Sphingobacterium sp. DR205]QIH34534.1 hypothetical protein G6053_17265 [Sphingobacterium sp. DR205]
MKNSVETQIQIPDNISQIAQIVKNDWKKVYFGAVPYLIAMQSLNTIQDYFYEDSGTSIVNYFLANATTWRGETARQVKAKLKQLVERQGKN